MKNATNTGYETGESRSAEKAKRTRLETVPKAYVADAAALIKPTVCENQAPPQILHQPNVESSAPVTLSLPSRWKSDISRLLSNSNFAGQRYTDQLIRQQCKKAIEESRFSETEKMARLKEHQKKQSKNG